MKALALIFVAACLADGAIAQTTCDRTVAPGGAIQKAINTQSGLGGGTVCLSAGTHLTTDAISLPSNIKLVGIGASRDSVVLKRSGTSDAAMIVSGSGTTGTEIHNLTVDGSIVATYGILLYQTQYGTIDNVSIDHVKSISVGMVESYHIYFFNSYVGPDLGQDLFVSPHFWITNTDQVWIADGDFVGKPRILTHEGDGGFAMYGSTNVRIYGNYVLRGGTYMASSSGVPSSYIYVWGNTYEYSNEWPMDVVEGANNILISDNQIRYAFHGAMVFWNANTIEASYNLMENNNQGGFATCQGINNNGSTALNVHDNAANPGPVMCTVP